MFGGGGAGLSTGVFTQRPRYMAASAPWKFKQSVPIGRTALGRDDVQSIVREMKSSWTNSSYDLTAKNCNHFSDALARRLGCSGAPAWLNRAARVGNAFRGVVSSAQSMGKQQVPNGGQSAPRDVYVPTKYSNIIPLVDRKQCGCLNQRSAPRSMAAMLAGKGHLESDSDEQLLLQLPLTKPVALRTLVIHVNADETCPKTIKVFVNNLNVDFSDAEDLPPTAELEVAQKDSGKSAGKREFKLPIRKCSCVQSLVIFIQDNHGADTSIIRKIELIGREL